MPKQPKSLVFWCERITVPTPYFGLCLTEEAFKRELKRLKHTEAVDWITGGASATVHTFESDDSTETVCVVCLDGRQALKRSETEIVGMLFHEAVHIWQGIVRVMREQQPSDEFEAYTIQRIGQALYWTWLEWKKKQRKKKTTR